MVFPGITDDPHVFQSTTPTALLGEAINYFTAKGLDPAMLASFSQTILTMLGRLDDPPVDQLAPLDEDIQAGPVTVYRLREGVERFMITDINNPASASMAQSTSAS